jgi:hypothetical protein
MLTPQTHPCASWCRFSAFAFMVALFGSVACQQRRPAGVGMPTPGLAVSGGAVPQMKPMPPVNLSLPSPDRRLDLSWLDLDEFMPPGAKRVGPLQRLATELMAARRTQFPSTELCVSPDKRFVLFHDGMKRKQRGIHHWLLLLKNEPTAYPNTIFGTRLAFEASWAEDSQRFAVTHFVGDNASEVFVVDTTDLVRKPIEVRAFIEEHFPQHLALEPMFLKAYRWTRDGRLVVRAIGRAREEPYELFGCEVLVAFAGAGAEPQVTYLRGYVKAQEGR